MRQKIRQNKLRKMWQMPQEKTKTILQRQRQQLANLAVRTLQTMQLQVLRLQFLFQFQLQFQLQFLCRKMPSIPPMKLLRKTIVRRENPSRHLFRFRHPPPLPQLWNRLHRLPPRSLPTPSPTMPMPLSEKMQVTQISTNPSQWLRSSRLRLLPIPPKRKTTTTMSPPKPPMPMPTRKHQRQLKTIKPAHSHNKNSMPKPSSTKSTPSNPKSKPLKWKMTMIPSRMMPSTRRNKRRNWKSWRNWKRRKKY
mmetsp:Transcript_30298/g.62307  ORF Transcript_30298/g.62307 Transcript_30298/m.62307 type:complete len:250 (-) Transcript_30298:2134-2883(-)